MPIVLELPEEYATVEQAIRSRDSWQFTGMTRSNAMAVMNSCGFTTEQSASIASAPWQQSDRGCSVTPSDALTLSLAPACRAAFYAKLMIDPANKSAVDPSWFRAGRVDMRLRGSGLSNASTSLLKELLYPTTDDTLLFADLKPAVRSIADPAERLRFLKAVTRKRAMMVRLLIDTDADTDALATYWGRGRRADLRPLLDSMKFNAISGVERPGKMNVATILPPFVQERLYRHADVDQPVGREPDDCYWTAFNFFSDTPDDRVHEMSYLADLIQRKYERISEPSELGDVILFADANGDAIHAANYIADDVVFTKNGMSGRQPWILVSKRDLVTQYRMKNPSLTIGYFRLREPLVQIGSRRSSSSAQ